MIAQETVRVPTQHVFAIKDSLGWTVESGTVPTSALEMAFATRAIVGVWRGSCPLIAPCETAPTTAITMGIVPTEPAFVVQDSQEMTVAIPLVLWTVRTGVFAKQGFVTAILVTRALTVRRQPASTIAQVTARALPRGCAIARLNGLAETAQFRKLQCRCHTSPILNDLILRRRRSVVKLLTVLPSSADTEDRLIFQITALGTGTCTTRPT